MENRTKQDTSMPDDTFIIDDDDRYSRFRLIHWWDQDRLSRAKILVVGAGALGNEVLKNLALLGVGHILVVDFDKIEKSNLTRSVLFRSRDRGRTKAEVAAEALRDLNPHIRVTAIHGNVLTDIGLGVFRDVNVVIGCLDNRESRLWVNRSCWKVTTPWIDGGIEVINGVVKVFTPPDSACYECGMTENDYRLINLRYSCPLLRQEDLQSGKVPTAPTISSMIGGLQTQEALKLVHAIKVPGGEALVYNGVANQFYRTRYQHRDDCLSHETYPEPVELPFRAGTHTASELFAAVREHFGEGRLQIVLDRDLVVSVNCDQCGTNRRVMKPLALVAMSQGMCPECNEMARPEIVHSIESDSDLVGQKLGDLGIAPYDIVRVAGCHKEQTFLLGGDRDAVMSEGNG
ncbi:MAG: ThiF family adenylyltransferase [Planctomycetes bacterium]|nr:ThiF family adenylyltransferase [Planctomycetota bacterium]MBL7041009.1 ThiF family adenylyltransferase [Pirellulaceae bacterium]